MAYLELSHINKEFAKAAAVNDFNLSAEQGEFISFLGPSGCGKTTTLRMIAGFELPTSGKIQIDGKDLTLVSPNKRNVGMVFQSYALFPNMTVAGNIAYGLKVSGKPNAEIKHSVDGLSVDLEPVAHLHQSLLLQHRNRAVRARRDVQVQVAAFGHRFHQQMDQVSLAQVVFQPLQPIIGPVAAADAAGLRTTWRGAALLTRPPSKRRRRACRGSRCRSGH